MSPKPAKPLPGGTEKPAGSGGTTFALHPAGPLRLDGGHGAWLVTSGHVDLFALCAPAGTPAGRRHPLGRVGAGELMLALPRIADHAVIAVGYRDTTLRALEQDQYAACPPGNWAELIDRWIVVLASAGFGPAPAWPDSIAAPGQQELSAGSRLYAPRGLAWAVPRSGELSIAEGRIRMTGVLPLAAGLSLRAEGAASVEILSTVESLARGYAAAGLERFHGTILTAVVEQIARADDEGRRRLAARRGADRRGIASAVRQLAGTMGGQIPEVEVNLAQDHRLAAFAAVAAAQGIALPRLPALSGGWDSMLAAVARANGVGLRRVLLRGEWWRRENGPMLGWRGNERNPVALLPARNLAYRLVDPIEGQSAAVDGDLAAELAADAVVLYRPLPDEVGGVAGLVRFAWRGSARDAAAILAMGLLAGGVAALVPVATGFLLAWAVPRAETGTVLTVVLGLFLAAIGAGIFDLTKAVALLRLEARFEAAMQPAVVLRLLALPVTFFRDFGTGDLTNRALSVQTMRRLLAVTSPASLLAALFGLSSFIVILVYSPLLALVAGGLVGLAAAIVVGLAYARLRQERTRIALRGQEDSLVVQVLEGLAKLRVAASEARVFARWAILVAQQKRHLFNALRYGAISETVQEVYPILAILVLLLAASKLIAPGDGAAPALSLGGFLAVNAAFGQLLAATTAMARTLAQSLEMVPLFERLRPIVTAEPEAREYRNEPGPLSGRIEICQVRFRYAGSTGTVLDDLSLEIAPAEYVALVGPSGGGKSTVLRLLLGFETAESGDILFDGQSIATLDPIGLRHQIGAVLQHSRLRTGSIFDNITNGIPYKIEDAWAAARFAGIDADIEAMPMGIHTLVMEGASTLSGGQRQRLMIARALIGKPSILLFDEATSALDNRSQAVVTRSLDTLRITRIVVAHRLSTIERADRILVIDDGRVVETGTYAALMSGDGPFSRLARRQLL